MLKEKQKRVAQNSYLVKLAAFAIAVFVMPARAAAPADPAPSAPAPQSAPAWEEIQELDEVVVRGKHLKQEIEKAEDEYFAIFNDVNKDDRYDTHCVSLQLDPDSRLQGRACIPGFVADAMAEWAPYKARCQPPAEGKEDEFACLDRNGDRRLSYEESGGRDELQGSFSDLDVDGGADGYLNRDEFYATCRDCDASRLPAAPVTYMPPPPEVVLTAGSAKWYEHMLKVTSSDPRLKKMADHLGDLYHELAAAQRQFDKLDAAAKPKTAKRNAGPKSQQ